MNTDVIQDLELAQHTATAEPVDFAPPLSDVWVFATTNGTNGRPMFAVTDAHEALVASDILDAIFEQYEVSGTYHKVEGVVGNVVYVTLRKYEKEPQVSAVPTAAPTTYCIPVISFGESKLPY